MKNITIEATGNLPSVEFDPSGWLKIEGRSILANASEFYIPLIEFANELDVPSVKFDINLDYINTASSKQLLTLLKTLDLNENLRSVIVNWFDEEGDDDSLQAAEMYEGSLKRVKFTYNEVAELN